MDANLKGAQGWDVVPLTMMSTYPRPVVHEPNKNSGVCHLIENSGSPKSSGCGIRTPS